MQPDGEGEWTRTSVKRTCMLLNAPCVQLLGVSYMGRGHHEAGLRKDDSEGLRGCATLSCN